MLTMARHDPRKRRQRGRENAACDRAPRPTLSAPKRTRKEENARPPQNEDERAQPRRERARRTAAAAGDNRTAAHEDIGWQAV